MNQNDWTELLMPREAERDARLTERSKWRGNTGHLYVIVRVNYTWHRNRFTGVEYEVLNVNKEEVRTLPQAELIKMVNDGRLTRIAKDELIL